MSDLGYQSDAQASVHLSLNSLDEYTASLVKATTETYPPYQDIGIRVNGEYRQLNDSLLQIENEYYATMRPKRVAHSGERPSHALQERGVEYIEVRSLDLDPFLPVGIDEDGIRFLDMMMISSLLESSPPMDWDALLTVQDARHAVYPKFFIADIQISKTVQSVKETEHRLDILDDRRNEFEQRF